MPHATVKVRKGTSEEKKKQLANAIVEHIVDIVGSGVGSISVSIEEIEPNDWKEEVYEPLIRKKENRLFKKPQYSM